MLTLLGAGAAAALTGCRPAAPEAAPAAPDMLLVQVEDGPAVLRPSGVERFGAGLATPDGATVFAVRADGVDTVLSAITTRTGRRTDGPRLAGAWVPRVASADGRLVALAAPDSAGVTHVPAGRSRTPLVVADATAEVARLELTGNVVPDAFTAAGEGLFVLDWLPPAAPDRYRVRRLDLASGEASRLFTRLKAPVPEGAEEEMSGQGRLAVYAPNRQVLYTLYTHQPDHAHTRDLVAGRRGNVHAFVHTLHLNEQWAYCVDLPAPFGEGPGAGHTVAMPPEGTHLYVADVTSGRIAVIDAVGLTVQSVLDAPRTQGTAHLAATSATLFLATGDTVHAAPRRGVTEWSRWDAGGLVSGLAASPDGRRVYAALPGAVAWFDAVTGARQGEVPVPGLTGLTNVL